MSRAGNAQRWISSVSTEDFERYAGTVLLAKVEVDLGDNMKLAGQYQVRGFPGNLLFSAGEVVGHFSGARSARYIHDFLAEHAITAPSI